MPSLPTDCVVSDCLSGSVRGSPPQDASLDGYCFLKEGGKLLILFNDKTWRVLFEFILKAQKEKTNLPECILQNAVLENARSQNRSGLGSQTLTIVSG